MESLSYVVYTPWLQSLGWALLHFLWQGALIGLLAAGLMAIPVFRSPQSRYGLGLVALLVMLVMPVVTAWVVYEPKPDGAPKALPSAQPTPTKPFEVVRTGGGNGSATLTDSMPSSAPKGLRSVGGRPDFVPAVPRRSLTERGADFWAVQRARLSPYVAWGVLLWLLGVFVLATRNTTAWLYVRRLRTNGVRPVPRALQDTVDSLRKQLGVARAVLCLQSTEMTIPATAGWLRPLILLPASTLIGLDSAQLEAVLVHELAHIRRHDYLVNLVQALVETALFYHPAVWWLSNRIRLERELCCDDMVVKTGTDPVTYAEALIRVAKMRPVPEMALAATGSNLLLRIRRLAGEPVVGAARPLRAVSGLLVLLGIGASALGPNLPVLFAQGGTDAPGARTINFPEWTMGQVMVRPWGSARDTNWEPYQPAMGSVNVPEGMEVQLVVDNNAVNDLSPLSYLGAQDLQSMSFRRTEVQDDQLAYIEGMELRELNFEMTEITNEALQYFDDMTSLESLSVGRTNVNNEGMPYLSGLTGLRQLDLNLTGVNDEGLADLTNLRNLEYLDLWNARVTDESMAWIGTLTNLEVLGLEGTPITDAGLAYLRDLVNLQDLNLQGTPTTDLGVENLASLAALTNLNLRNTRITEGIVDSLIAWYDLQRFNLPKQISPEAFARMEGSPRYGSGSIPLKIYVKDRTSGKAIAGAEMEVKFRQQGNTVYTPDYFWTGEKGDVSFYLSHNHTSDVSVYAEGYVPASVVWEPSRDPVLTVTLQQASKIGGIVVNEGGEPVEGVSVNLAILGERSYDDDALVPHAELTGKDGKWSCVHAPEDLSAFWVELEHPEYIATMYEAKDLSIGRLKSRSERLFILMGIDVSGTVKNEMGEPVVGAGLVELVPRRQGLQVVNNNTSRSGEDGNFQFSNQKSGPIRLKINAGGYLPSIEDVEFRADAEPLRFTLKLGRILKGKVVDQAKKPIKGVRIEVPVSLGNGEIDHVSRSWKTVTDHEGRFLWDEAPEEPVSLTFAKRGCISLVKEVTATGKEIIIVMGLPVVATGTVLDGETGAPIPGARLDVVVKMGELNRKFGGGIPIRADGTYVAPLSEQFGNDEAEAFQLSAVAPGYESDISRWIAADEGEIRLDFSLHSISPFAGTIITPDGEHVAGATVHAVSSHHGGYIILEDNAPRVARKEDSVESTSNEQGEFTLNPPKLPADLFATSASGFVLGKLDSEEDSPVVLTTTPWASMAVHVLKGPSPEPVVTMYQESDITLGVIRTHMVSYNLSNHESIAGHQQVIPGEYLVQLHPADDVGTIENRFVSLKSDVETTIEMGGGNLSLTGAIAVPEVLEAIVDWDSVDVVLYPEGSIPEVPKDIYGWEAERRQKWLDEWWRSEAGTAAMERYREASSYATTLDEERSFVVEGVQPGAYTLRILFLSLPEVGRIGDVVAVVRRSVTMEVGDVAIPTDLGTMAPSIEGVEFREGAEPLELTLKLGGILKGKVVDHANKPIEGVRIEVPVDLGNGEIDPVSRSWKTVTDPEGRFLWDEAPEAPVSLTFTKRGYNSLAKALSATSEDIVVVMEEVFRPVHMAGIVMDAESGEVVTDYKIEARYGPHKAHFSRIKASSDGSYAMDSRDYGPEFTLTVEADGYFFQTSPTYRMVDGDVTYDFQLERAPQKAGVLRTPDGNLAVGAQYVLATPFTFEKHAKIGGTVDCRDGSIDTRRNDRVKETGDDGRFSVCILESPSVLIVTHEDGFVRINVEELEDEAELPLRPWARVEGIVKIGSEPAPNARLFFQLERRETPTFSIDSYSTNTDEFGRFSVARVFPGHAWIRRMLPESESGRLDFIVAKHIDVPEGETVHVELGGTGRPVQGRVIIPNGLKERLALDHGSAGRISERYPIDWPADSDSWSEEEKLNWRRAWFQSDEGKKAIRHQNGYCFFLDEDGRFQMEDVEAGSYTLSIRLVEYVEGKRDYEFPLVGTVEHAFDVPEMEGGRSDEPLDLGALPLDSY